MSPLREVAWIFLKLGTTAFGGPAAHIAMMEDELVRRRQWVTREEFLDLLGAAQLIPGPNSTELAIHLGRVRAGWAGLVVAGCCFILPAMLMVMGIAWMYQETGELPVARHVLDGIQPVIVAVIVQALWGLAKTAIKGWPGALVAALCVAAGLMHVNELLILVVAGLVVAGMRRTVPASMVLPLVPLASTVAEPITLQGVFGVFLKIGSVLYGSGYVLLAFLRADLVERLHWMSESQLIDSVAVGQVTPGPVFTTATFIGYVLAGPEGAVVATVGIFLPAFFFVAISGPLVPRIRRSAFAGAFLDGVNIASLALMAIVSAQLGMHAVHGPGSIVLCLTSLVLLVRFKVNSTWLVAAGAIVGLAIPGML